MQRANQTLEDVRWRGEGLGSDARDICLAIPPMVNSFGVWEKMAYTEIGMRIWEYPLPLLEFAVIIVLVLWQLLDFLFKKLGLSMPKFTSQMLIGVALSQLNLVSENSFVRTMFFPGGHRPKIVETFGAFGFTLYWFLKGVKMDVGMISRTGARATVSGVASVCVPVFVLNMAFGARQRTGGKTVKPVEYRIMIFMQSLSAFTGIAKLLEDMKLSHSELGRIALSAAMVGDMVALAINFLGLWLWAEKAIVSMAGIVGFILVAFFLLRPAMFWVIRRTPEGRPVKDVYVYAVVMLAFLSFFYWEAFHQFPPFGPFVFGLAVPDGPPLGSALVQRFESFNTGIVLPVFVTLCMMQLDVQWLVKEFGEMRHGVGHVYEPMALILLAALAKFVACTVPPYALKMPLKDSIVLALILCHKGIVELGYYTFAVEGGFFKETTFNVVAFFILLNSLFLPIAIQCLYDPSKKYASYRKRNLVHLKPNSELRVLVCIHKPDHITSAIKVLEASCTPEDSSLACYVVHLVELLGQDNPAFISHQIQRPKLGSRSCSDNVIISFEHFQRSLGRAASVDTFTSISLPKHMHDDVCLFALDRSASIILLPFHRTWSVDRSTVVSDDDMVRNLNCRVLRTAPCSVGILVDRNTIKEASKTDHRYQICVIFVGGKDDREALALTKRMARNPRVGLTVVRFVTSDNNIDNAGWEQMLDRSELKDVFSKYVEETVRDGTDTSKVLRSMAYDYDLFVVGQSSGADTNVTKGLGDWNEFEELGVIGDILASPDFSSSASVLIIQQQQNVALS